MIMAVKEGDTVVRLSGGDPFIWSGGEEVEHLQSCGHYSDSGQWHHRRVGRCDIIGAPLTHRRTLIGWCLSRAR
jgi:uroporphyrin-III C-methyltransferase